MTSFTSDDMYFLNNIPETVQLETMLISFDVTGIYTNIQYALEIEFVNCWWGKYGK